MVGQAMAAPAPATPTVAARIVELENRTDNLLQRTATLERAKEGIISLIQELRGELGLQPLDNSLFD